MSSGVWMFEKLCIDWHTGTNEYECSVHVAIVEKKVVGKRNPVRTFLPTLSSQRLRRTKSTGTHFWLLTGYLFGPHCFLGNRDVHRALVLVRTSSTSTYGMCTFLAHIFFSTVATYRREYYVQLVLVRTRRYTFLAHIFSRQSQRTYIRARTPRAYQYGIIRVRVQQ